MPSASPRPAKRQRTTALTSTESVPQPDPLVPIRLDLTLEGGRRIQETFTWSLNETQITPRIFAAHLCQDLSLPESARELIEEAILEQISAFSPPTIPTKECRHVVRLALRVGRVVVRDQFEWDLHARHNSPESFAETLCKDLGLETVHVPAVAHAIREQLVELAEFRDKRVPCPVVTEDGVVRPLREVPAWEPAVECLTVEEQERLERKEKREARLMRRNRGKAEVGGRAPGRRRNSDTSRRRSSVGF